MFGHNDNNQPIGTKPVNPGLLGIDEDSDTSTTSAPPVPPTSTPSLPVTPPPTADPVNANPSSDPASNSTPTPKSTPTPNQPDDLYAPTNIPTSSDELVSIKRQALQELSPLIDHLEQNAEEKFKTTMMMIQASDNQDLIPQAFKTAKEIPDEKRRAQALLDLVNEINYFTHKTED